jgi:hypothetical protein
MFTKDNRTENFLTQMGVDYSYTNNLSIDSLVDDWQKINIARPVPIREEAVEEYASLMESGSAAPAPIIFENEILDGVQRIAAAELFGATKISAYIVKSDSEDVTCAIRVLANARLQGRAEPAEWTRRKAVEVLVVGRGLSIDEVARMGGWKKADIATIASAIELSTKVQSIGGPILSDKMLKAISGYTTEEVIEKTPVPIAKFFRLIKTANFSTETAEPYIEQFFRPMSKPSKAHSIFSERFCEFAADPEVEARVKGRRSVGLSLDIRLRRALKTCITVLDEAVESGSLPLYIDEFFKLSGEIDEKLHEISPQHRRTASGRVPSDMWKEKP